VRIIGTNIFSFFLSLMRSHQKQKVKGEGKGGRENREASYICLVGPNSRVLASSGEREKEKKKEVGNGVRRRLFLSSISALKLNSSGGRGKKRKGGEGKGKGEKVANPLSRSSFSCRRERGKKRTPLTPPARLREKEGRKKEKREGKKEGGGKELSTSIITPR